MFINRVNFKILSLFLIAIAIIDLGSIAIAIASDMKPEAANKATQDKGEHTSEGLPTHRRDGGSRSQANCLVSDRDLIALIPHHNVGLTASISPQVFFYVPETTEPKTLEFVVRDEDDKLIYETFVTHNGRSGIINLEIPATVRSASRSKSNYHWYLSMICDPRQRSKDIVVEGWMKQVAIDSETQKLLTTANPIEQAEIYQRQGIWYDALSVLARSKADNTSSKSGQKWFELLQSVGLPELSSEPLITSQPINTVKTSSLVKEPF